MSDPLAIALAQLNFKIADVDANAGKIKAAIERARQQGANLVVFSEIALLGYPPRDLVHRRDLLAKQDAALEAIAAETDDQLAVLIGYVGRNDEGPGHDLINGAAFCANGKIEERVAKQLLPTYDVFDEARYFAASDGKSSVVNWQGYSIGVSICEDAWANAKSDEMPIYETDPIALLADEGADILVNLSASPFSLGKAEFRRDLLAEHCRAHELPLVFVNQIGAHDELIFDGRSLVFDARGEVKLRLTEFDEDFDIIKIGADKSVDIECDTPLRPVAESRAQSARDALVLGIRDYVQKTGFSEVLIGLSGGIDSTVTAALATEALGAENVHGVAMPSRYSSSHSREDARRLADNLGIKFDEIAIEGAYAATLENVQPYFDDPSFGVAEENIQARLRGLFLMALSNKTGKLVLACGNKSELAVGYSTLYGDMCGALMAIGDLPKMLVYDVARHYNEEAGEELIPRRVLEKAPSAELRPDQKDEDSLPPYEVLDDILERYLVDHQTVPQIVEAGFDGEIVDTVITLVHRNEYKRWQAPPVLKVTTKAFGVGWRYPLAAAPPR